MSFSDDPREGLPRFGVDYDLARWSTGDRDDEGKYIWETRLPNNDEWESIRLVTLNLDPEAEEGFFRTYHISPDRPLDPYGVGIDRPDFYDLDDLAQQAFLDYGFEV